jgi:hypothetical protein
MTVGSIIGSNRERKKYEVGEIRNEENHNLYCPPDAVSKVFEIMENEKGEHAARMGKMR